MSVRLLITLSAFSFDRAYMFAYDIKYSAQIVQKVLGEFSLEFVPSLTDTTNGLNVVYALMVCLECKVDEVEDLLERIKTIFSFVSEAGELYVLAYVRLKPVVLERDEPSGGFIFVEDNLEARLAIDAPFDLIDKEG